MAWLVHCSSERRQICFFSHFPHRGEHRFHMYRFCSELVVIHWGRLIWPEALKKKKEVACLCNSGVHFHFCFEGCPANLKFFVRHIASVVMFQTILKCSVRRGRCCFRFYSRTMRRRRWCGAFRVFDDYVVFFLYIVCWVFFL